MRVHFYTILVVLPFLQMKTVHAQESILDAGVRIQKTVGLYWENGFSFQYSHKHLKPDQFYFGITYVTSRLGSAINSNAIKQDNYLVNASWYFKSKHKVRMLGRLNVGYFVADYEDDMFNELQNTSFIMSPELGVVWVTNSPIKVNLSMGYNLFTGNGQDGAGTLYPMYFQTTVSWNLLKR